MPGSTLSTICSSSFKPHKNPRCTSISILHIRKSKPTKAKYTVKVNQRVSCKTGMQMQIICIHLT